MSDFWLQRYEIILNFLYLCTCQIAKHIIIMDKREWKNDGYLEANQTFRDTNDNEKEFSVYFV